MAEMHPSSPLKGALSSGERKVFFGLQDNLPAAFTALHSVALLTRPREAQRLLDKEVDFIVGHPEYGLLVIEVKGGGIRCDARGQRWTSISADGVEHDINNPYEQARRNFYALQEELHARKLAKRFPFPGGYAVWFPDIELDTAPLGLSATYRQITLDATALRSPEPEILRIFRECLVRTTAQPPTEAGIAAMVSHLMPSWEIPVRLRTALFEEEDVLVEATRSQYKVLSMLGRRKRALICGCAGSGKTFLAVEKARRLAEEARDVLTVCFNARLAGWLRSIMSKWRGVDVFHYHALCTHVCSVAGMPKPQPNPYGDSDAFYRYELPEAMLQALESFSQRYDAILVDEAQDFDPIWWIGIEQLLRDPADSLLYLFFDDNQLIYGSSREFPVQEPPLFLCENCRNTRTIFDGFMRFYQGDAAPESVGPGGRPVEVVQYASESDELPVVTRVIRRLLQEERIPASAITILTPRMEGKSIWKEGNRIGASAVLSWAFRPKVGAISCSSIHTFKGLENSVIILTEMHHAHEAKRRELFYVAYSRAKFHLIVSRSC
jgi:hypothetical protein